MKTLVTFCQSLGNEGKRARARFFVAYAAEAGFAFISASSR